jgi:hypothetical protein
MWRNAILTAVLLLALNPSESRSQPDGVTLDPVIGQVGSYGIGIGQIILPLRATWFGPSGTYVISSGNSFELYSPDGASISAIEGEQLAVWASLFTFTMQGEHVRLYNDPDWWLLPEPTPPFDLTSGYVAGIGFAGVSEGFPPALGMPSGYDEVAWKIRFVTSAADIGKRICLDQAAMHPYDWIWVSFPDGDWIPEWNNGNGVVCFCIEPVGLTPVSDPPGSPVEVDVDESLALIFDDVTSAGVTTVTTQTGGPVPPGGYQIIGALGPVYYDIETTAGYSGDITVCFTYDETQISGLESDLTLWHWSEDLLVSTDITSSVDEVANIICGVTSSLSLFALAEPPCCSGRVGDANSTGDYPDEITLGDIMLMVDVLFISNDCTKFACPDEADVNQSGGANPLQAACLDYVSLGDIMTLVDFLFITGPETAVLLECL